MMSRMCLSLVVTAVLLAAVSHAYFPADMVDKLPLFNHTLRSRHFSGYLRADDKTFLHYYFMESLNVAPFHAPLILWMNGGPGCSSMEGWGNENGPFVFHSTRKPQPGVPLMEENTYTWARFANMLFLESPAGVGFSYRTDGNYTANDEETAKVNHDALVDFFTRKFPEFRDNKLYIAGESYGGIYVPTLVQEILNRKVLSRSLAGMIIGNGVSAQCTKDKGIGCRTYVEGNLKMALYHDVINQSFYDQGVAACSDESSVQCLRHQNMFFQFTQHVNVYNVYETCVEEPRRWWEHVPSLKLRLEARARQMGYTSIEHYFAAQDRTDPPHPDGRLPPCVDVSGLTYYLGRADVREALHVPFNFTWAICSDIRYTHSVSEVAPIYQKMRELNLSILVYNGNVDAAVSHTYVEYWMDHGLGFPVTRAFHPWTYDDPIDGKQRGGSAVQRGNLWYVTVHGSGHMVPQDRPQASIDMLRRFLWEEGF